MRGFVTASPARKVLIFLVLTALFSLPFWILIILQTSIQTNILLPLGLMWSPGTAGLLCSFLFGHRFQDIGFRRGRLKYYLIAYAVPAGVALFIFAGLLLTGTGAFELSPRLVEKKGSVEAALIAILLVAPIAGIVPGFVAALGEEMGWRGFLLTQAQKIRPATADFGVGFIWSLWHWPLIFLSDYATSSIPLLSAVLFSGSLTALAPFYGWLRRNSGSIFPLAVTHASHNLFVQAIYPAFLKKGPLDPFFGGESGIFCLIAYAIVGAVFFRLNRRSLA